jgi:hypothetical protein
MALTFASPMKKGEAVSLKIFESLEATARKF